MSNHYHLPRISIDLANAKLRSLALAAEAFILLEDPPRKDELIRRLGGNAYAERVVEEIQGIAHKIQGTYKPRTDTQTSR